MIEPYLKTRSAPDCLPVPFDLSDQLEKCLCLKVLFSTKAAIKRNYDFKNRFGLVRSGQVNKKPIYIVNFDMRKLRFWIYLDLCLKNIFNITTFRSTRIVFLSVVFVLNRIKGITTKE
jgi:hypothetical protein